jgi:hypothetical protein
MEGLFSTQSIMVMLLITYGVAMWLFLSSAPKVYTIMVSNLEQAKELYGDILRLAHAKIPLQYYGYEQGIPSLDPLYVATDFHTKIPDGMWFQLKKNTQLHVVRGAHSVDNRSRHVCFDRECIEKILLRVQKLKLKHKIRSENPLVFWVKDSQGNIIEIAELNRK